VWLVVRAQTILTARSNDGGADAIAFREGELWLVQAKHTKKDSLINSVAMGDLMAAAQTYAKPLSYSLHLLAVTNGNFAVDTRNEAARNGIRLLDRHKLMADLRINTVTLGAVYAREDDRYSSFADGVRAANRWFE
jgi:HJR/Mrr/RecB family endonuclease